MDFTKYQGLGNDFIIFDIIDKQNNQIYIDSLISNSRLICDRRFGIGADGIIIILPSEQNFDVEVRIINSDSTEAEMCGNGIRCVASYLSKKDSFKDKPILKIRTLAGLIITESISEDKIKVNMGSPILIPDKIPTKLGISENGLPEGTINIENKVYKISSVGMGNPHLIIPVDNLKNIPINVWGPYLENHNLFPFKTNVHFLKIHSRSSIELLVWERGCGETLACGTGACASVVSSFLNGSTDNTVYVQLPGGRLLINFDLQANIVYMTGDAVSVYSGTYHINLHNK